MTYLNEAFQSFKIDKDSTNSQSVDMIAIVSLQSPNLSVRASQIISDHWQPDCLFNNFFSK